MKLLDLARDLRVVCNTVERLGLSHVDDSISSVLRAHDEIVDVGGRVAYFYPRTEPFVNSAVRDVDAAVDLLRLAGHYRASSPSSMKGPLLFASALGRMDSAIGHLRAAV